MFGNVNEQRRITTRTLIVAVLAVAIVVPAIGSVTATVPAVCPVCGAHLDALTIVATDSRGGVDRDLFARSDGSQHVFYRISTCTIATIRAI